MPAATDSDNRRIGLLIALLVAAGLVLLSVVGMVLLALELAGVPAFAMVTRNIALVVLGLLVLFGLLAGLVSWFYYHRTVMAAVVAEAQEELAQQEASRQQVRAEIPTHWRRLCELLAGRTILIDSTIWTDRFYDHLLAVLLEACDAVKRPVTMSGRQLDALSFQLNDASAKEDRRAAARQALAWIERFQARDAIDLLDVTLEAGTGSATGSQPAATTGRDENLQLMRYGLERSLRENVLIITSDRDLRIRLRALAAQQPDAGNRLRVALTEDPELATAYLLYQELGQRDGYRRLVGHEPVGE